MTGLLSPSELGAIEEVAELGMQTPVSVLRYMRVERKDNDDLETWVETATTTAMIWDESNNPRPGVQGGVIGEGEAYKALLRKEIEVHPGDQLGLAGEIFRVTGSSEFDTYAPAQILSLRRFE
jgi:hypothetical protein